MGEVTEADRLREAALCRLVNEYQVALTRVCFLYLRDRALAEDAVQETFLKAYKSMARFRGDCGEKAWLMRIAVNTCRDFRRSAWFWHVDRRVTPDSLPEATAPFEERDEELTLAVMRLPVKQKEALLLYYYQDMTVTEIAEALKLAPSTVSNRLTRAKKLLRAALERGRYHE